MRSKVLSMILVLALVFTSTGVVFGAETGLQKVPVQEKAAEADAAALNAGAETIVEQEAVAESAKLNSGAYTTMPAISATTILYSNTKKVSKSYSFQPNSGAVIPVKAQQTGIMYLDASNVDGSISYSIDVWLCDTLQILDGGTSIEGNAYEKHYLYGGDSKKGDAGMRVTKGKTYYIAITNASYNATSANITVTPYVYTTEDRTLSPGTSKWTIASGYEADGTAGKTKVSATWFKIKPKTTGQMTVKLSEFGSYTSGDIRLYNSKKKAISEELYCSSSSSSAKAYFGVKKGTTYYLKVTDCNGSYDKQYKYGINYSVKKKTDRNLATKNKAKTLKRKAKATESLFVASTKSSTDWYKIRVTSKRKNVIYVDTTGMSSGKVTITAYKGSKKVSGKGVINAKYDNKNEFTLTTSGAGTYYLKVVKDKNASGSYKIRYKR